MRAATLHQAVTLIGRRAVGRMALEAEVCSFFERAPGGGGTARGQQQRHALQVAGGASELARRGGGDVAAAHLAGLLHDLGKLVLPAAFDVETLDAIAGATPAGPARAVAEREALGVDHAVAGARFAEGAGLDATIVDAIRARHGGVEEDPDAAAPCLVVRAVQAANATVAMLNGHPGDDALLDAALEDLGLQLTDLEEIATTAMPADPLRPRLRRASRRRRTRAAHARRRPVGDPASAILVEVAAAFPHAQLEVSVSIGTATAWSPGADLADLLKRADAALYEAKRAGRGMFRAAPDAA